MIQVRSEENGVFEFYTLQDALAAAKEDSTIWKISFNSETNERVRLVKRYFPYRSPKEGPVWSYEPIEENAAITPGGTDD